MTRRFTQVSQSPGPFRVMRVIARLNIGGPAIHVSLLTAGLQDDTFTSRLVSGQISPGEGDMEYVARDLGVEPTIIRGLGREISPLDDLWALIKLVRLMRAERPHIVHTHTAKAGFLGRLAARLAGVPVIVHTFHGHVFKGYFGRIKTHVFIWIERFASYLSDVVLTISDSLRDDLIRLRIVSPERIRVVPLGLDLHALTNLQEQRGRFRSELGVPSDVVLVGIIGRLVPIKNHELFLQAAKLVHQVLPQTCFVIVGDGEERPGLEALTAKLGLMDTVRFAGWRSDLPVLYADLGVLVCTSRNEGTPVSLIEAMAAGVPVVSTSVGGVPDLLQGGKLGVLVSPDDPAALAEAILTVLQNNLQARTLEAQNTALSTYGADRLVRDIRRLYLELLAKKGFHPAWEKEHS